jgi:hypothetical protein
MLTGRESKKDCAHCKIIRYFLYAVIPIMIMFMTGTELEGLRGIMLTDLVAWVIGIGFVLMVTWKAWNEFWR